MVATLVALAIPAPVAHASPRSVPEINLLYGRSGEFWPLVESLDRAGSDPNGWAETATRLDEAIGRSLEGVARFDLSFQIPGSGRMAGWIEGCGFGMSAEAWTGGRVRNPVEPRFEGQKYWGGEVRGGCATERTEPVRFGLGTHLGLGKLEKVDGDLAGMLDGLGRSVGDLWAGGVDAALGWGEQDVPPGEEEKDAVSVAGGALSLSATRFVWDRTSDPRSAHTSEETWRVRWRLENRWQLAGPREWPYRLGVFTALGPDPVPVPELLPRAWDFVFPSVRPGGSPLRYAGGGAMVGWGGLRVEAGLYGGYWGATADARLPAGVRLRVGSLGFEESRSYRSREGRLEFAQVGWAREF